MSSNEIMSAGRNFCIISEKDSKFINSEFAKKCWISAGFKKRPSFSRPCLSWSWDISGKSSKFIIFHADIRFSFLCSIACHMSHIIVLISLLSLSSKKYPQLGHLKLFLNVFNSSTSL